MESFLGILLTKRTFWGNGNSPDVVCLLRVPAVIFKHKKNFAPQDRDCKMTSYDQTLKAAKTVGASRANDAELMALFCEGPLQTLCGAVSPALVWQGAQTKGLSSKELAKLANTDSMEVAELMWL